MQKKLFSLLLAVLMVFSLLPVAAFATDGTATITVGSITDPVDPGETIQIPVSISNNPGFAGAAFAVNYDANVLEPLTPASNYITNGSELPGTMSFTKGAFVEMSNDGGDFTGNGEIFVLNFTVKADTTTKNTEVSVALKENFGGNFSNYDGNAVPVEFVSGTIAINGIDLGPEAKIGGTTYDTLREAIEAAASSTTTIEVLRDIDSATATKGYFGTLDLCGYTIGTLNLYGGDAAATGSNSIKGKLTNGTINNLNMTQGNTSYTNQIAFGTNITIGTVTATGKSKFEFPTNTAGINITNFNYDGSQNWYMYSGTIENMSYKSSGGMLKQEGGTINHCTIPGGSGVHFSKKAVVYQLTDENKASQCELGGTFGFDPSNYIIQSNRWKWVAQDNGDGTWSVVSANIYVANNKGYSSIGDACTAAGNTGTVTLGSAFDASKFYGGLAGSSSISKSITLDLKGYSLKPTAQSVSSVYIGSGANWVTLKNTGSTVSKLEGYSGGSVVKIWKSEVTIDGNIELVGAANIPIFKKAMTGASYPCSVIIENATVSSDAGTLTTTDSYAVDEITIEGGKYLFDPAAAAQTNSKIIFDTSKYHTVKEGDYYVVSDDPVITLCDEKGVSLGDQYKFDVAAGTTAAQILAKIATLNINTDKAADDLFTYTFDDWYVNGEKLTAETALTLAAGDQISISKHYTSTPKAPVIPETTTTTAEVTVSEIPADVEELTIQPTVKEEGKDAETISISLDESLTSYLKGIIGEGVKAVTEVKAPTTIATEGANAVKVGTSEGAPVIGAVQKVFEIDLKNNSGTSILSSAQGEAKITLSIPFELPTGKLSGQYDVYYINGTVATKMNATYKDGKFVFETGHLSTYAIAVNAGYSIIATPTATNGDRDTATTDVIDLYSGDTVTVDVTVNGGTFAGADVKLGVNSDLFEATSVPTGWTAVDGGYRYIKAYNGTGEFADGTSLGTFTFTVKDVEQTTAGTFALPSAKIAANWDAGWQSNPANECENTQSANVNVIAQTMTADVTAASNLTYDGNAHALLTAIGAKDGSGNEVTGITVKYSSDNGQTYTLDTMPSETNAGTYTVYYQISKAGYATVTGSAQVTIAAANIVGYTTETVTLSKTSVFKDGTAFNPVKLPESGTTADVTIQYSSDNGTTWADSLALTDAGTYPIKVKVTKDNYNDVELAVGTFTITDVDFVTEKVVNYISGYDLILVFTNSDAKFAYDGSNLYDLTALGYKYGTVWGTVGENGKESVTTEGTGYNHVYGILTTSGDVSKVAVSNSANVTATITAAGIEGLDLNGSNGVDINDIVAAQGVYNVNASYLTNHMNQVFLADTTGNKKVDTQDVALIKAYMLAH